MAQKSRKIRAIAAGGAVLGVGAAITLAAWTDFEFADGQFNSGNFGIQAAANGGQFGDQAEAGDPLTIQFGADAMVPGETVTALYQIRNIDNGQPSVVTFTEEGITGELADSLTTEFLQVGDATCEPGTTGKLLERADSFNLVGTDPQNLCVKVTLADITEPTSQGARIAWQFNAELLEETEDEGEVEPA